MVTGASADSITWNFATTPNASLGNNTFTYSSAGVGINATGSQDLYYKLDGWDENGLGEGYGDHEIEPGQNIVLDLSSLFSKNVTSLTLMFSSIQKGETGQACDVDMCISFGASDDEKAISIMSLYSDMLARHSGQLTITALTGDVLVNQLQATTSPVPEPTSLLLTGSGVLLVAGIARKLLT
jgi:hypothetical protein